MKCIYKIASIFLLLVLFSTSEANESDWAGRWQCRYKSNSGDSWKIFLDIYQNGLAAWYPDNGRCKSPEDKDGDSDSKCDFQIGSKYQSRWEEKEKGILLHAMPGILNYFFQLDLVNGRLKGVLFENRYDSRANAFPTTKVRGDFECKHRTD